MKDSLLEALQDMRAINEDANLDAREVEASAKQTAGKNGWRDLHTQGFMYSCGYRSVITRKGLDMLDAYGL